MTTTPVRPALYRVKDVAKILAISEWEVRRLIEVGTLHRRYVGEGRRFYRVTAQSVETYLESLTAEPKAATS